MGEKDLEFKRVSANFEILQNDKERLDIKCLTLKRENRELSDSLHQKQKQIDTIKSDLSGLSARAESLRFENENIVEALKGLILSIGFVKIFLSKRFYCLQQNFDRNFWTN